VTGHPRQVEQDEAERRLALLLTDTAVATLLAEGRLGAACYAHALQERVFAEAIERALLGMGRLGLRPSRRATRRIAAAWLLERLDQALDGMLAREARGRKADDDAH
jgi:hypothetical protein